MIDVNKYVTFCEGGLWSNLTLVCLKKRQNHLIQNRNAIERGKTESLEMHFRTFRLNGYS